MRLTFLNSIFSYGVMVGIGAGLSFPPTVYIVTSYFVKLRGLANGLCISGSALGSIILPPVLRWLLENYGYRTSVLTMGALTLNVFVAALLYEPVEQHMVRVPKKTNAQLEDIEEEDIGIVLQLDGVEQANASAQQADELKIIPATPTPPPSILQSPEYNNHLPKTNGNEFVRSASAAVVQHLAKQQGDGENSTSRVRKISTPVRLPQRNQTFTTAGQLNSQTSLYAVPETGQSAAKLERLHALRNSSRNRLSRRSPSTSSFQYISTPYHGSTLSFQPKEFSSHLSLRSMASGPGGTGGGDNTGLNDTILQDEMQDDSMKTKRSKFFDLSLLRDPMYLVILISNSTNAISYTNFIILLPAYGKALSFNKSLSAYLISIVSITDLIGRIGGSALSDLAFIPKAWYFVGGLAVSGLSLALLPFAESYEMLSFYCSVFGLASGIYVGITAVIMADMLGEERLTSSYGISLFVNGILQLIGPPICGAWFEAVGTYKPLFHTLGMFLLAGASLWSFMPFIQRNKAKEELDNNDFADIDDISVVA